MNPRRQRLLDSIYLDPAHPASFGGPEKLYAAARKKDADLTRSHVREFLTSKEPYTLFRRNRIKFSRLRIRVKGINRILGVDLADMQKLASSNENFRYFAVCVDCYSRYLWIYKLKTKSGPEVRDALKTMMEIHPYPRLFVDQGETAA